MEMQQTLEMNSFISDEDGKDDDSLTSEETCQERDEVQEVRGMSQGDTNRVRLWRFVVTFMLLLTASLVTYSTYRFLKDDENNNFKTAFERFSLTVGNAAIEQQRNLHVGLRTMADTIEGYAETNNLTWPFVTVPLFEMHASNARKQANSEIVHFFVLVENKDRKEYENYSGKNYKAWVEEGHLLAHGNLDHMANTTDSYHEYIYRRTPERAIVPDTKREKYLCSWQFSPPPKTFGLINWNLATLPAIDPATPTTWEEFDVLSTLQSESESKTVLSAVKPYRMAVPLVMTKEEHAAMHSQLSQSLPDHPHYFASTGVHKKANDYTSDLVGKITMAVAWDFSLLDLLPEGVEGIHSVIKNTCNQSYTYEIVGREAIYVGVGDLHEPEYDDMELIVDLVLHDNAKFETEETKECRYAMHVYPSKKFKEGYDSNTPQIFAAIIAITFAIVIFVFFVYDLFVQRRNERLIISAARSNAIVSSMFPSNIRDQLIGPKPTTETGFTSKQSSGGKQGNLKTFLNDGKDVDHDGNSAFESKPLADLFLETSVLFADIVGFTAWSSEREPSQVFMLLETVYSTFDKIAKRRRVFKVETVGDCYVAVTGLPEPRYDHAIAICRFAKDILLRMQVVTKELEVILGPDTGELGLRIGIHSGPVTGGLLRGDRSRFQLFGDTMNTCARIESTSKRGRIQVSEETASLLIASGRGQWVQKRADKILAKGKGKMATYWLTISGGREVGSVTSDSGIHTDDFVNLAMATTATVGVRVPGVSERTCRLIDWNVEMLLQILKKVVAHRNAKIRRSSAQAAAKVEECSLDIKTTPLEEVREIIALPKFDKKTAQNEQDPTKIEISKEVIEQLQHYVSCIASMYRDNPFHNFDHASHVVMSVVKLMSRIVAPASLEGENTSNHAASLHDHTYGITSDPLTQFACALSALIHDADHTGVPNTQLIKENAEIAALYSNRSVAEQNSLDLAWNLLMEDRYADLRGALYTTEAELKRFRQLIVNSVMATDIIDKDLKNLRNQRWDKAFRNDSGKSVSNNAGQLQNSESGEETQDDVVNRKATIVIEHLIQASDVSHTMQHWHVFRKWNEKLFEEMYDAFKAGRAEKDPSEFWYKGEIGFFDFYIIPLAKKLKNCGVFGVSSDEYLNYAMKNRQEWEDCGEEVVAEMIENIKQKELGRETDLFNILED